MDFNVKKLASDAGVFFTRAVQVRYTSSAGRTERSSLQCYIMWIDLPSHCGCVLYGWRKAVGRAAAFIQLIQHILLVKVTLDRWNQVCFVVYFEERGQAAL